MDSRSAPADKFRGNDKRKGWGMTKGFWLIIGGGLIIIGSTPLTAGGRLIYGDC
jgi:hypothetical protein